MSNTNEATLWLDEATESLAAIADPLDNLLKKISRSIPAHALYHEFSGNPWPTVEGMSAMLAHPDPLNFINRSFFFLPARSIASIREHFLLYHPVNDMVLLDKNYLLAIRTLFARHPLLPEIAKKFGLIIVGKRIRLN